jgi:SAM-dependent methyltransferase
MGEHDGYLLGMTPGEVARLADQHEVWRERTTRLWTLAGVAAGQTVVDLGCGPGFTSLDLAGLVGPAGRVVAVDASKTAIAQLARALGDRAIANVIGVEGNAGAIDLGVWSPDVVLSRWLFCFLPDPAAIVRRIADALAPGATLAVMDYAHYLAVDTQPSAPIVRRVFRAVYDSWADAGGSLDVAGLLPTHFDAAGLRVIAVESLSQAGGPGSPVWRWVSTFQRLYLPTLVEKGYLTEDERAAMGEFWASLEADPGALFFAPPILGVVGRK